MTATTSPTGERVVLGRTTVHVDRLIVGTAPLASYFWGNDAATAVDAVVAARAAGLGTFDTAPLYGLGESEQRLGEGLRRCDDDADVVIATKVGRQIVGTGDARTVVEDFSAAAVLRQLDASLERLGRERVDIVHVHDPEDHLELAVAEAFPALAELRAAGRIGAVSVGTMVCATARHVIEHADPDVVMIANRLTLLDRSAVDELLPVATAAGVPVLAAAVFNSGVLARPATGAWFDYEPAAPEVLARVAAMQEACAEHGVALRAAALQYPLRHAGVAAVVVGVATAAEVADDVALAAAAIPSELWERLDAL